MLTKKLFHRIESCWSAAVIDAEMLGKPPPTEMTLEQLVEEENLANTSIGESDDDAIVVLDD